VQQQLRAAVRQQPDVTLFELRQPVQQAAEVWLSKSLVWLWLQRLELRRKKNPSTRRNKTVAKTSGGAKRGGNR
jgi:transposase